MTKGASGENSTVRFGTWEADLRAGELRRNGVKVKLQDQPFQVLSLLLERPGELVTREELRSRLWPGDTFVDFDHSLNTAVARLRDALGDSADNPRFVETLARRGYRFIAPVSGPPAEAEPNTPSEIRPEKRPVLRSKWIAAGAALALAGISVGWHIGHRTVKAVQLKEYRLTMNSSDAPVYSAAISPDGKLLAYSDPRGIFLKQVDSDDSHTLKLPSGFQAHQLSWFPDGSHLLVAGVAGPLEKQNLWNVPILGGAPRKIAEDAAHGSVSPDGKEIAYTRVSGFIRSDIYLMNAESGEERKALSFPGFVFDMPAWSPDSRKLAYLRAIYWPGSEAENIEIDAFDTENGSSSVVLADDRIRDGVAWTRDCRLLFSRAEEPPNQGESNVWAVHVDMRTSRTQGRPERLTNGPDGKPLAGVSLEGKRMLYLRTNIAPTIYVADVNSKNEGISPLRRLTLDERQNRPYEWTPDGKAVLYVSNREGVSQIFRQEIGAPAPEPVTAGTLAAEVLRLSPDGTQILFLSAAPQTTDEKKAASVEEEPKKTDATGTVGQGVGFGYHANGVRLMRMPIGGGTPQVVLEDAGLNNFQCARAPSKECLITKFTKDSLVFLEFDATSGGSKEVMRLPDADWGYNWTLSPDGNWLAVARGKGHVTNDAEVRVISLRGKKDRVLKAEGWAGISSIDWAADGKSIWASVSLQGETRTLVNIDLQGHVKPVLQEAKPYVGWAIPSQDGKHLAIWESTGGANVWMVDGF